MVDHPFISLAGMALILFVRIYQACLSPFFGPAAGFTHPVLII
jgi:putative component of membrane protein insertase Oxa1/YidC/SpoIIIJ protein YidD